MPNAPFIPRAISQLIDWPALPDARFQPLDADLTAYANAANAAARRTLIGAGTSSFDGVFASLTSKPTTIAGYGITDFNTLGDARWQTLDADLTAIAALTTTSFGRSFLALADAAAGRTLINAETSGAAATAQAAAVQRSNHTGTQLLSTISNAGTMAAQAANAVAITGGTVSISDLTVNNGGISSYVNIAQFLASSNGVAGNSSQLLFGVGIGSAADWRYIWQGDLTSRVDFAMSGEANPVWSYLRNGKVGFGTTTPSTRMEIYGLSASTATIGTEDVIQFTRPNLTGAAYPQVAAFKLGTWEVNGAGNNYGPSTRLDLALKSASDGTLSADTVVLTLLSNGRVGIGTTTPGSKLSIIGLPTSSAGLSAGDVWSNSGVLTIV